MAAGAASTGRTPTRPGDAGAEGGATGKRRLSPDAKEWPRATVRAREEPEINSPPAIAGRSVERAQGPFSSIIGTRSHYHTLLTSPALMCARDVRRLLGRAGERERVTLYVAVEDAAAALKPVETQGGQTAYGSLPTPDGSVLAGSLEREGHLVGPVQGPARP
jgi:hypothetical protein